MESSNRRTSIIRHPLRDPTILGCIFRYLPVEDLKACRMTLKLWHEPATRILTEKIQGMLLHEKTEWKKFLKVFTKSCTSTRLSGLSHIHPFHSFIFYGCYPEDPSWTPYKSAILDYMHAKVKLPKKTVWEDKFFATFGLQVLELRYCQFNFLNTERSLREFREMLSTNCPNLSALTLEFQKEQQSGSVTRNNSIAGNSPSPSPTPSPTPQIPGSAGGMSNSSSSNVFFPPNEESLKKSMDNLKRFVFCTDNKCWVNPNALEEFMSFMPSLEEFTYRYTGAKKQWAFVRRVDVIDILCNLIQCGSFLNHLKVLDLDSKGTVLSGEDFRKLGLAGTKEGDETSVQLSVSASSPPPIVHLPHTFSSSGNSTIQLIRFASQVFIKSEQDWDYFCSWLSKFNLSLKEIDIQVRSHFSQLPAEEQLPAIFPKVTTATLLLDNNFQVFLRRMPNVQKFCGVYDNELLPFCSATQNISLDGGTMHGANNNGSSSPSSADVNNGSFVANSSYYQLHRRRSSKRGGGAGIGRTWSVRSRSRSKSVEGSPAGTPGSASGASGQFFPPTETSSPAKRQEAVTQAKYLRIFSNEESMLDIEWKAGLFQHVTSLETDVYFDQDLRLIWTHLHLVLEELILHLKTLIPEQAFTGAGVPAITFQELCRSHSKSGKGKDTTCMGEKDYHDEEHITALEAYPNLGMMKKLRRFEVHTEGRQDAFGTQFSASIIIFGVSLLSKVERLVLPPAIPPKCLENSISYLGKLTQLRYLAVCDDTFQSVLPFHVLKSGLPDLEIVVKYYQSEIKRTLCNPWRTERLIFPDFLPEHRSSSLGGNGGNPLPLSTTSTSSVRSRFYLSKQCSAP